jgi:hypothetical protein
MRIDKKFLQRAFLAFTTGLFLACAARISTADAASPSVTSPSHSAHPTPHYTSAR